MARSLVTRISFNEDTKEESYYFIKRLVEKILIDQLELTPNIKGSLLISSSEIIEKEKYTNAIP